MKRIIFFFAGLSILVSACNNSSDFPSITSVINFRELGGYQMKDGRTIRNGMLLRGAALEKISSEDSICLSDVYNLSKVYDLRSHFEVKSHPDKSIGNSEYVPVPALDSTRFPMPKVKFKNVEDLVINCAQQKWMQDAVEDLYYGLAFGDYCRNAYSKFLDDVIRTEDGAVYWHCSQGKDRTGFAAALILYALGADKDLVIADFSKSRDYYANDVLRVRDIIKSKGGDEAALRVVDVMISVSVENFVNVLDSIDRRFGSPENYLEQWLGVTPEETEILKSRYLE